MKTPRQFEFRADDLSEDRQALLMAICNSLVSTPPEVEYIGVIALGRLGGDVVTQPLAPPENLSIVLEFERLGNRWTRQRSRESLHMQRH